MIGNFLNGGSNRGAAFGFKLNTLVKLIDTKTVDNKSSLMHYLVKVLKDKYRDIDLISFSDELKNVVAAKRVALSILSADVTKLRKGLAEAENDLKLIPKMEGVDDVFHKVVPRGIKKCRAQFENLESDFTEAVNEYEKTAELYGESPKVMAPEQFFENISTFIHLMEQCVKELEEARIKEEKQKKREEEAEKRRIKEEAKRLKKEEEKARLQAISMDKKDSTVVGNQEGVMDTALASLRGGEAFEMKRKERQEKRMEEEKALFSVMDTLNSFTSQPDKKKIEEPKPKEVQRKEKIKTEVVEDTVANTKKEPVQQEIKTIETSSSYTRKTDDIDEPKSLEDRQRQREEKRRQREAEAQKEEAEAERKRTERKARLAALRSGQ